MTRERTHQLLDLVLDFNEKMGPQVKAGFDTIDVPSITIYFENGWRGYGHIEHYDPGDYDFGYDYGHGEKYSDAHLLHDVDINLIKAEERLKELMGAKK